MRGATMTRRRLRKPCPLTGKVRYRDQGAALSLGRGVLRAYLASEAGRLHIIAGLWVYECKVRYQGCGDWHLTSQDQGDETRKVKL